MVLPAGSKRSSFKAGLAYVTDSAHRAWLLEEESESDEPYEQEEKSVGGSRWGVGKEW